MRYFVGINDMLVGLHVPRNFQMYRQKSEKALLGGGGNCPPPPPSGYANDHTYWVQVWSKWILWIWGPGQRPFPDFQRVILSCYFVVEKIIIIDICTSERSERVPHNHVYFQISESEISWRTVHTVVISTFIIFIINSFTIHGLAERCCVSIIESEIFTFLI